MGFIRGIDVSHWSNVIDWLIVRIRNIIQFAIHKATEGTTFLDNQWNNNRAGCKEQKFPYGAYHFYRNSGDPTGQADWFIQNIQGVHIAVCDVESIVAIALVGEKAWKNGKLRGADEKAWKLAITAARNSTNSEAILAHENAITSIATDVKIFLYRLRDKGYHPVIYSSPGFLKTYFQGCDWLAEFDLWIAHIGVQKPSIPDPWKQYGEWGTNPKVKLWQDTWTLVVEGVPEAAVDGDLWWSETESLYDWFGNGEPYVEPPTDLPDHVYKSYSDRLRIRDGIWGNIVDFITSNLIAYKVLEGGKDSDGVVWYRIGDNRWIHSGYVKKVYDK